jgi:hypothetical protein
MLELDRELARFSCRRPTRRRARARRDDSTRKVEAMVAERNGVIEDSDLWEARSSFRAHYVSLSRGPRRRRDARGPPATGEALMASCARGVPARRRTDQWAVLDWNVSAIRFYHIGAGLGGLVALRLSEAMRAGRRALRRILLRGAKLPGYAA